MGNLQRAFEIRFKNDPSGMENIAQAAYSEGWHNCPLGYTKEYRHWHTMGLGDSLSFGNAQNRIFEEIEAWYKTQKEIRT